MAHLFPHKEWWPDRPQMAIFTVQMAQWVVGIGTILGAVATGGSVGLIVIIAVGVISLALLTGLRWVLELLVWQVEREEMAAKRAAFPEAAETVES